MATWGGNDKMLRPDDFRNQTTIREIATSELGRGDAFQDLVGYLTALSGEVLKLICQNYRI